MATPIQKAVTKAQVLRINRSFLSVDDIPAHLETATPFSSNLLLSHVSSSYTQQTHADLFFQTPCLTFTMRFFLALGILTFAFLRGLAGSKLRLAWGSLRFHEQACSSGKGKLITGIYGSREDTYLARVTARTEIA